MMTKCIFCERAAVLENGLAKCFYDVFPVTPGHLLIVPKRHTPSYWDLMADERSAISELIEQARQTSEGIDGWNIGVNIGEAAGQTVDHCHVHLIPRRAGDTADPRGGVRGVITDKQKY